ncbi:ABC transporter ATP-binding protein [Actinocatenispora rupis]|uniref:Dipeptide/oligopeptide/nickel ABC transporter ATP-binding protein n=1 Tax=Actinocatenispora rupis TaxID=519421 RepID=A0A8J3JI40_9ACTN|nr:ABC transporter ATP-binding protein [Actinocatenispora rupis]GID15378.1 dipeptide/oligopeptide/nickel ABC transporter ATP-binding protein [Actinocatenispora rupis]
MSADRDRPPEPEDAPPADSRSESSARTSTELLAVRDLRIWYGTDRGPVRAVDRVSLDLAPGQALGLVGESGCGKSTLGRGLLGMLPPAAATDGEIRFQGRNLIGMSPARLRSLHGPAHGMIFQEPLTRLDPLMRVSEHFEETLHTHQPDLTRDEARHRALSALRGMGIPPTRYRSYPHEFSGGMRQRIMIALTLVLRPAFVVADEPTTALDVLVEAQIVRILADLRRNFATALLLITHNLGIVAESCDRVAVMYAGRIVEEGDVRQVFGAPAHPYTRELLASTISLATTELHYIPGAPPDLVDPPPGCRFHPRCPEAMRVCPARDPVDVEVDVGHRAACWLHGPESLVPPGMDARLTQGAIGVADEA